MKRILISALILSVFALPSCAAKTPQALPASSPSQAMPSVPAGAVSEGPAASAPKPSTAVSAPATTVSTTTPKPSPTAAPTESAVTVSAPPETAAPASAAPESAAPETAAPETAAPASAAPVTAAPETAASDGDKNAIVLEGMIGTLSARMTLSIRDGAVSGSYYYNSPEHDLKLTGSIEENRMLTMKETDASGTVTGTFSGYYVPGIRLTGSWTNAKTNELLTFSLNVQGGIPKDAVWSGEWHRLNTGRFASATLVIFNETKTSLDFQIDAFNGAHMGFINGTAIISGTTAVFKDAGTGEYPPGAEVTLTLQNGFVTLTANDAANGRAGAGVVFGGDYTRDTLPEDTLLTMGYVTTKTQDAAFRTMTGKDYDLFLNTANLREDAIDLDGLGAIVNAWWVHGFKGTNESIVMFLPGDRLCAAVIDPEKDIVKVFTNDATITAVPKTIQAWIDGLHKMPVEFRGMNS